MILTTPGEDVKIYEALQLHFHAPSEHTINGKTYDLELHIVHKRFNELDVTTKNFVPRDGAEDFEGEHQDSLSVLGIFFDVEEGGDSRNSFIDSLNLGGLANITNATGVRINTTKVDLNTLVDGLSKSSFFHYHGSLTTPPCG